MAAQNQVKQKLAKLARMHVAGVSQAQIAAASGLSESRISQIFETKEYKAEEELVAAERFEEMELLNQGWDGIESFGVQRVLQALQADPEPEFALRAAVVANKAVRRGGNRQQSIHAQPAGMRAVIHLKATFVESLQQNFELKSVSEKEIFVQQKESDFMPAKEVQGLLQGAGKEEGMEGAEGFELGVELDINEIEMAGGEADSQFEKNSEADTLLQSMDFPE